MPSEWESGRETVVCLTCVHQLGHALGLQHTPDFADLMYQVIIPLTKPCSSVVQGCYSRAFVLTAMPSTPQTYPMPTKSGEQLRREVERLTRLSADLARRADKLRAEADTLTHDLQELLQRSDAAAKRTAQKR